MESALKTQAATAEENQLTFDSFFRRMATFLNEDMLVLADTSLCLFPSEELVIKRRSGYIAQAVWLSIGYTTGGTLGAGLAYAKGPVVTFTGDGGFQMIPQMLSTLARNNSSANVFIFNNRIYGMEQFLVNSSYFTNLSAKPEFYNNLPEWKYECLAEAFGVRVFIKVQTNHELEKALATIGRRPVGPVLVEVVIPPKDLPACFRETAAHPAWLTITASTAH
jgi:indolepyruvate decarboxylase